MAGFIEPGESLEEAASREVDEETNVTLSRVQYICSQPWPFPSQLMLGCIGEGSMKDEIQFKDGELQDAKWISKQDIQNALLDSQNPNDPNDMSVLRVPPHYAIAHTLMRKWAMEGFEFSTSEIFSLKNQLKFSK